MASIFRSELLGPTFSNADGLLSAVALVEASPWRSESSVRRSIEIMRRPAEVRVEAAAFLYDARQAAMLVSGDAFHPLCMRVANVTLRLPSRRLSTEPVAPGPSGLKAPAYGASLVNQLLATRLHPGVVAPFVKHLFAVACLAAALHQPARPAPLMRRFDRLGPTA
jgi:hypothetical protein